MGRHGPSDAADQALTSHHGVPPPEAAHLRNFERTRVLRANLHRVQHRAATRADGALSARQASIRMFAHARTVGPFTVARWGSRAASPMSMQ